MLFSSNPSEIYTEDFRFIIQTVEAVIDKHGKVQLLEQVNLPENRRALVTILEEPCVKVSETALLSESALAEDWNRPEEDKAWSYLHHFCMN